MLGRLHWGLVPFRGKDASAASKRINARVETVREKPGLKNLLRRRRCAIPADGFYEWRKICKLKQSYFLAPAAGSTFAFAGLWDTWKAHNGAAYDSCTIIITEAQDTARLEIILPEGHETAFTLRSVSGYIDSPKNNDEKGLVKVIR
jgi:putative SOS response-associated peptidase YedK